MNKILLAENRSASCQLYLGKLDFDLLLSYLTLKKIISCCFFFLPARIFFFVSNVVTTLVVSRGRDGDSCGEYFYYKILVATNKSQNKGQSGETGMRSGDVRTGYQRTSQESQNNIKVGSKHEQR